MKKIVLQYNGSPRQVTKEQLEILLQHGFVSNDSILLVDGQEVLVRDFMAQNQNSDSPKCNVVPSPISQDKLPNVTSNTVVPPLVETVAKVPGLERDASPKGIGEGGAESNKSVDGKTIELSLKSEFKKELKTVQIVKSIVVCVFGVLLIASGLLLFFFLIKSVPNKLVENTIDVVGNEWKPVEAGNRSRSFRRRKDFDSSNVLPYTTDSSNNSVLPYTTDSSNNSEESNILADTSVLDNEEVGLENTGSEQDNNEEDLNGNEAWFSEEREPTAEDEVDETMSVSETDYDVNEAEEEEEKFDAYDVNASDSGEYDNVPFDDSIDHISPDFKGCNLVAVYAGLLKAFYITKGEYETTAEFKKRKSDIMQHALSQNIVGSITPTSRIASVFTTFEHEYDADSRKLICSFEGMPELMNSIQVIVLDEEASYYTGVNAFGVEKEVAKAVLVTFGISSKREFKHEYAIPVTPNEAKKLDNHLGALVVFTIDPQKDIRLKQIYATDMFHDRIKPKMSLPYDIDYTGRTVFAKDVEIWFYDDRTGEIILKTSAYRNAKPTSQRRADRNPSGKSSSEKNVFNSEAEEDPFMHEMNASNSEDGKNESEAPEVRSQPTWQELLSESVDEPANWEKKKPTLTVPGDADTLAEAIEKAEPGDVIQLKKSSSTYSLGVKLGSDRNGVVIDKALAIVGETGEASEVTIEVGVDESIFVETKGAMFKGITFQCGALGLAKTCEPIVSVGKSGYATFKYCSFVGNGVERSIGVETSGKGAKSAFWKCDFKHFGDSGLLAKDEAVATLRYCEFLDDNHYAFTSEGGASVTLARCHFVDITESRFAGNKRRADISPASRNRVKESENVYDE